MIVSKRYALLFYHKRKWIVDQLINYNVMNCLLFFFIMKVFEGRNGCALILCAIYHEVARKMDILCEPVIGLQNTAQNAGTNRHIIFLKWKDSAR